MKEARRIDEATGLTAGRLEGIAPPDLLWSLYRACKTGVLRVSRADVRKSIYFDEGQIVFAASSDPNDRLGEILLRSGQITLDQLEQAVGRLHSGKRIGTLLVESGNLSAGDLVRGVLFQVESIVLDLFHWDEGVYRFHEERLPTEEVITLGMKTGEILSAGIRRLRSFGRVRRHVGGPRTMYERGEEIAGGEGRQLSEPEQMVLQQLGAGQATVEDLCRDVLLSNFEVYQTLWMLKVRGLVRECERSLRPVARSSHRGRLEQQDFLRLLVSLCRSGQTGVLHVSRGTQERSFHLDGGRCVFATSNDPDDGLVAYLVIRGFISLRDREEAARRLLSNKRVGTILREMGVIDELDLREMVRQQLSEIVYDTFAWTEGDFGFVPGELPTVEAIALESSLETLVVEGLKRIHSWSRVKEGCGGLDVPMELTPSYLDALDAMSAGSEEWQVVNALKTPQTAAEVCRSLRLGDFRTCQLLWALCALGAVRASPEALEQPEERPAPETTRTIPVVELDPGAAVDRPARTEIEDLDEAREVPPAVSGDRGEPAPTELADEVVPSAAETQRLSAEMVRAALEQDAPPIDQPADRVEHVEHVEHVEDVSLGEIPSDLPVPPIAEEQAAVDEQAWEVDDPREEPREVPTQEPTAETDLSESAGTYESELEPAPPEEEQEGGQGGEQEIPPARAEPLAEEIRTEDDWRGADREPVAEELPLPEPESPEDDAPPSIWDMEQATRTVRMSSDMVDAALSPEEETSDAPEEAALEEDSAPLEDAPGEPWEPPRDLEQSIARFNAMQRMIYRTVRAEIGAGAANFIRSCCIQEGDESSEMLGSATLHPDGSWDTQALRDAILTNRLDDPGSEYQRLIDREIELVRAHISEPRVIELQRSVEKVSLPGPGT